MLRSAIGLLAGTSLILFLPAVPDRDFLVILVPCLPLFVHSFRWRWLGAFIVGVLIVTCVAEQRLQDRWPLARNNAVMTFAGCVEGLVERQSRVQRFQVDTGDNPELPQRLQLSLYAAEPQLAAGQCWTMTAKLRSPRGFVNPGGFDYERWLFREGIGATGYVRELGDQQASQTAIIDRLRQQLSSRLAALDPPAGELLAALAIGDRNAIEASQWNLLRDTGTAHLVAISGLHIGLVAGLGWWLAGAFRRPDAWRLLPGMMLATGYALLAGMSLPVQRALIMLSVIVFYRLLRRRLHWSQGIGLALWLVLLRDPLASLDTGFWLSFGAIAAILVLIANRRDQSRLWSSWRVQVGLSILLAPLLLGTFGLLPLASIPANLLAIPLFTFVIVPAVLLGLPLLVLPAGSAWASAWFTVLGNGLDAFLRALQLLADTLPPLDPYVETLPLLLAVPGLVILFLPLQPVFRLFGVAAILPLLLVRPDPPGLRVVVLDVGQGQAVVIETRRHTVIYDTGPVFGDADAAQWVILPYLRHAGRRPDLMIASHGDQDHAGGLATLQAAYPGVPVLGRTVLHEGQSRCSEGMAWNMDGWHFEFLYPAAGEMADDNNSSCVLRIHNDETAVLLTGDIEAPAERALLQGPHSLAATLVTMPHHGSMTSSTSEFVAAVRPAHVAASAGFGNRWHFPRDTVTQRWQDTGARVAVTGKEGALRYTFRDGEWMLQRERVAREAIWRSSPVR